MLSLCARDGHHVLTCTSCCMLQNADLAICDLTITQEREHLIDFTMPFMNLGKWPSWLMACTVANKITDKHIARLRRDTQISEFSIFLRRNEQSRHFDTRLQISFSWPEASSVLLTLLEYSVLNYHNMIYDLFYHDVFNSLALRQ